MTPSRTQGVLADHHRELETACRALLARTFADEPDELIAEYRRFERAVLEHIEAEEDALLPAYEEHDPADARVLRDDHAMFRRLLFQIGVDVELRAIRADHVTALVDRLAAHAVREERGMYPWIEKCAAPVHKRRLVKRVAKSIHDMTRKRESAAARAIEHTGYSR